MVVGSNLSKEVAALHNPISTPDNAYDIGGYVRMGEDILGRVGSVGGMIFDEIKNDRPHTLKGTWVLEAIYISDKQDKKRQGQ